MQFHLCWFEVSGWYFGHIAGLLGTLNNEHYDDFLTPQYHIAPSLEEFTNAWTFNKCRQDSTTIPTLPSKRVSNACNQFFNSGIFSSCANTIDPTPFFEMCLNIGDNSFQTRPDVPIIKSACTVALAYIEACQSAKIQIRVPNQCVYCQLTNGSYVPEGTFLDMQGGDVLQSSDIVFLVEAKPCNANLTLNKSIMQVLTSIEIELQAHNIKSNRFAVVAFGGGTPFDVPHTVMHQNKEFTSNSTELFNRFSHIKTKNGNSNDVLEAIIHASSLMFRVGATKIFILLSCSECSTHYMHLDYKSILQYMHEAGISLHILADTEFEFERSRKLRHFFGIDLDFVYSNRFPEGDADTRRQLNIAKNSLGVCMPLALETNGSVFSARKLIPNRNYPIKRLSAIFGKRVAKTALTDMNQTCECSAHNTGVSYMSCSLKRDLNEPEDIDDYDSDFNISDWDEEEEDFTA